MGNFPNCDCAGGTKPSPNPSAVVVPKSDPIPQAPPPVPEPQPETPPPEVREPEPQPESTPPEQETETQESSNPKRELKVNATVTHTIKFTEEDVDSQAFASDDTNPLHLSEKFAKSVGFSKRVVHGMLIVSKLGLILSEEIVPENYKIVGFSVEFRIPAVVNDQVTMTMKVIKVQPDGKATAVGTCTNKQKKDMVYTKWEIRPFTPEELVELGKPSKAIRVEGFTPLVTGYVKQGKFVKQNYLDRSTVVEMKSGTTSPTLALETTQPANFDRKIQLFMNQTMDDCTFNPQLLTLPANSSVSDQFTVSVGEKCPPGTFYLKVQTSDPEKTLEYYVPLLIVNQKRLLKVGDVSYHWIYITDERIKRFHMATRTDPGISKVRVHPCLISSFLTAYIGHLAKDGCVLLSGKVTYDDFAEHEEVVIIKVTVLNEEKKLLTMETECFASTGKPLLKGEWKMNNGDF